MKKPAKLNLNDLKVESFVTSLNEENIKTVKGGTGTSNICLTILLSVVASAVASAVLASNLYKVDK